MPGPKQAGTAAVVAVEAAPVEIETVRVAVAAAVGMVADIVFGTACTVW